MDHFSYTSAKLLRVYEGPVAPEGRHASFQKGCLVFWLIRSGSVSISTATQSWTARKGDAAILGLGDRRQDFSRNATILSINYLWDGFDGRPFYAFYEPLILAPTNPLHEKSELLARTVGSVFGNPSPYLPPLKTGTVDYLKITAAFHSWLAEIAQILEHTGIQRSDQNKSDERIQKAQSLLSKMPLGENPDYDAIARMSGISRAHLERLFRAEYHLSPHAWFERRRLEFARHELLLESARIKEISLKLGFLHLSRFSNWFSQREGLSPRAFRSQRFFGSVASKLNVP